MQLHVRRTRSQGCGGKALFAFGGAITSVSNTFLLDSSNTCIGLAQLSERVIEQLPDANIVFFVPTQPALKISDLPVVVIGHDVHQRGWGV